MHEGLVMAEAVRNFQRALSRFKETESQANLNRQDFFFQFERLVERLEHAIADLIERLPQDKE
tara:strand:- start:1241 stop:1429 length:189 start_codon:yes stop_codon:yes gene_type:complete